LWKIAAVDKHYIAFMRVALYEWGRSRSKEIGNRRL
jgi:hypothetical protein